MKILVTGATGFIGSHLCERLREQEHEVLALSRDAGQARSRVRGLTDAWNWSPLEEPAPREALESADAVVHLAGEPVNGRWTAAKRRAIHDTRVVGTRNLVAGIAAAARRPRVLVSGSAIGYYGDRNDEPLPESARAGDDFLAGVCREWEGAAREAERLGVHVVRVRTGIVLGRGGGALEQMLLPAKLGVSGPLGSGRQWWAWIHIDDEVRILAHALELERSLALNAASPQPVRQKEFARSLGRVLGRPAFLPAPALVLRLVLGGFSSELLSSKRIVPEATLASGYRFRHPELPATFEDLLG